MTWQRTIGIDLALEGQHVAVVCDQQGEVLNKNPFLFTTNLQELEELISKFIPQGTDKKQVSVVMEPTSNAWLIISSFFLSRGFSVFIIKTQKSYDLRQFFKKHAKTDCIDAKTLAKMPFVDPEGLNPLILSGKDYFSLQKLIKFRENTVNAISECKQKIYAYFQLLNPKLMRLFSSDRFTNLAKAFYARYANPFKIKKDGFKKFEAYLNKKCFGMPKEDIIKRMFETSIEILNVHQDIISNSETKELPYDMETIQYLINEELDTIKFLEKKETETEKKIKELYDKIDPYKILKGIKGFGGNIIAPAICVFTGSVKRFACIRDYLGYVGLVPKTKQSVKPAKEGLKITKASQKLLKKYYCLAAETTRRYDIEFAHKYKMLINQGHHHQQAICALGNMLARRVYSLLKQREEALEANDLLKLQNIQYELRDLNHKAITDEEALAICKRDYPSKKEEHARLLKQKNEKAATASSSGQSSLSGTKPKKGNSTISHNVQPSQDLQSSLTIAYILAQPDELIQELIDKGVLDKNMLSLSKNDSNLFITCS